jgi:hypothetical protein
METITLSPEEAEKFPVVCYDKTWEYVTSLAPEYSAKLRRSRPCHERSL